MGNGLACDLGIADAKAKYDENIKNILSDKEILAWIMKNTTTEFSEMEIEEIVGCIEGNPEISAVRVNPGETNRKITGMRDEDKVPNEGTIYYDIRFYAYVPKEEKRIKIILNLEAQKKFNPGYQLVTRGVFYGGRMISAQLNTEFTVPDYDGLKKVYSIWICVEAPKNIGNSISRYSLEKTDIVAGIPDNRQAYDKLSVVMICLNEKVEKATEFLAMMNTLLSETKSVKDKMKELEEKYHICIKNKLMKELNIMCNLSDLVEERATKRGMERGMKQGMKQGMEQGMEQKLKELVEKMMQKGWSAEVIADTFEESVEKIQCIVCEIKGEI